MSHRRVGLGGLVTFANTSCSQFLFILLLAVHTGTVQNGLPPSIPIITSQKPKPVHRQNSGGPRLNKFVRRLHDMIQAEKDSGVVEWRRGLLVLFSTDIFAKKLLPKYFATKNFKTCTYPLPLATRLHPDIHSITHTVAALALSQSAVS